MRFVVFCLISAAATIIGLRGNPNTTGSDENSARAMPPPRLIGGMSLEESIARRRSALRTPLANSTPVSLR